MPAELFDYKYVLITDYCLLLMNAVYLEFFLSLRTEMNQNPGDEPEKESLAPGSG